MLEFNEKIKVALTGLWRIVSAQYISNTIIISA